MKAWQLLVIVVGASALALALAWIMERRMVYALREDLERWGTQNPKD